MELFTITWKLDFFLTTRDFRCVHHGWHGTHRFDIQVLGTRSTSSLAVNGRPLDFCLHRHPFSVNCLYHARMVLSVGGSFAYFARNARRTVTTDLLVWYSNTKNDFSPERPFSHCIHSHRLAVEMWTTMKNNLVPKKKLSFFYLYRLRNYVSCGFPITNVCNPGVHYETPCISDDSCCENKTFYVQ